MRPFNAWDWAIVWAGVAAAVACTFWAARLFWEIKDGQFY